MRGVWDAEDLRKEREMGVLKKREAGDMGQGLKGENQGTGRGGT